MLVKFSISETIISWLPLVSR